MKISFSKGWLLKYSDELRLNSFLSKHGIEMNYHLQDYLSGKLDIEALPEADVYFISKFDIDAASPKLDLATKVNNIRDRFSNSVIMGYCQEVPHYKYVSIENKNICDYLFGMSVEERLPELKGKYSYFTFPIPNPETQIIDYAYSHDRNNDILLFGAFRLARAQLFYRLLKEDLPFKMICEMIKPFNRGFFEENNQFPVNFAERFKDKVIHINDRSGIEDREFFGVMAKSLAVISFSRQISSSIGFHTDIDTHFSQMRSKSDTEFISTRIRDCAFMQTMCIANYDNSYRISGFVEGEHILMYNSYDELIERTKFAIENREKAIQIGKNLRDLYLSRYKDTDLIMAIKNRYDHIVSERP